MGLKKIEKIVYQNKVFCHFILKNKESVKTGFFKILSNNFSKFVLLNHRID